MTYFYICRNVSVVWMALVPMYRTTDESASYVDAINWYFKWWYNGKQYVVTNKTLKSYYKKQ